MDCLFECVIDEPQFDETQKIFGLVIVAILIMKHIVYPTMEHFVWNQAMTEKFNQEEHPNRSKLTKNWTFYAPTMGWNLHGIYFALLHWPIYVCHFLLATLYFILHFAEWTYDKIFVNKWIRFGGRPIYDKEVFDLITSTSLVILTKLKQDRLILKMPDRFPEFGKRKDDSLDGLIDVKTLHLEFDAQTFQILFAGNKNGKITDHLDGKVSRNELIIIMLTELLASYVHVLTHVAAERSAVEIQTKKIDALRPSMFHVRPLHEGLHHGSRSPASVDHHLLIKSPNEDIAQMVSRCHDYPNLFHDVDSSKRRFRLFHFLLESRRVVFMLVRKFNLPVNAEDLFLNCILHGLDHLGVYNSMKNLPFHSGDGSGDLWSYFQAFYWIHFWVPNTNNPLHSEKLSNHLDMPFYADLYSHLSQVDPELTDEIIVSCSF